MKDFKIELLKDEDGLDPKFAPHLMIIPNDGSEPKRYNKQSHGEINIAIKDINVEEYINRTPIKEDPFYTKSCVRGSGNMTSVMRSPYLDDNLVVKGDNIRIFGREPHQLIDVRILSKEWDYPEETRKKLGIDLNDDYDVFKLNAWEEFGEGYEYTPEGFQLRVFLKDKKFKKLVKRIYRGEIKTLGITLDQPHLIPGLYKEFDKYHLNSPWVQAQNFYFLPELGSISNLSKEDFDGMPDEFYIHEHNISSDDKHSYANFYITLNPSWLLDDMFD